MFRSVVFVLSSSRSRGLGTVATQKKVDDVASSLRVDNISSSDFERHRSLLNELAASLNLDGLQGWYKVEFKHLNKIPGLTQIVRKQYASNVARAVATTFPDHLWIPWYFRKLPKDYWTSKDNVKSYIQWLGANSFAAKRLEDWYAVTTVQLRKQQGGSSLLRQYDFSLIKLMRDAFPDHSWDPTKFVGGPGMRHWSNPDNQRRFMDRAAQDFGITSRDEWSRVTVQQIVRRKGGSRLLELHNRSLTEALDKIYGPSVTK